MLAELGKFKDIYVNSKIQQIISKDDTELQNGIGPTLALNQRRTHRCQDGDGGGSARVHVAEGSFAEPG